jgi:hypothetical protein
MISKRIKIVYDITQSSTTGSELLNKSGISPNSQNFSNSSPMVMKSSKELKSLGKAQQSQTSGQNKDFKMPVPEQADGEQELLAQKVRDDIKVAKNNPDGGLEFLRFVANMLEGFSIADVDLKLIVEGKVLKCRELNKEKHKIFLKLKEFGCENKYIKPLLNISQGAAVAWKGAKNTKKVLKSFVAVTKSLLPNQKKEIILKFELAILTRNFNYRLELFRSISNYYGLGKDFFDYPMILISLANNIKNDEIFQVSNIGKQSIDKIRKDLFLALISFGFEKKIVRLVVGINQNTACYC